MRRADRLNRLPASLAALALLVPIVLVGVAPPVSAAALTGAVQLRPDSDGPRADDGGAQRPSASGPVASTTTPSLSSGITVFGLPVSAEVTVSVPGTTPTGQVQVLVDGTAVASGELTADGSVRVPLPATVVVGRHAVTAVYAGAPTADPPVLPSSAGAARTLTVTRTLPSVRTDGTDWSVRRSAPKAIRVHVNGLAGVEPTGTVVVWVNGVRKGSATLDPYGEAAVHLATSTKTSVVVVTYAGDATYVPWIAPPRVFVVR